jgi:RNA polymerase sigma-70 factor (ECF subfamily)
VDDAALIAGTLAGRRQDFDVLVERYQRALYAFAYRLVHDHEQAADIVQATFLRAYTHLGQFAGRASFKTWLHQIALNECRALHRAPRHVPLDAVVDASVSRRAGPNRPLGEESGPAVSNGTSAATADPAAIATGWKPILERLITQLPLRQRAVVLLRIFSDLPFKEIARVEGISENAAKVNYHHAITRLREWLRETDS